MKFAIIGDIHANLEALNAVLEDCEAENIDKIFCLGDVVGYGANPHECVEIVKDRVEITIAGNHDYAITGKLNIDFFNRFAKAAVIWTRKNLLKEDLDWLSNLPLTAEYEDFTLVHGALHFPDMFDYIQTTYDAHLSLGALKTKIGFFGHSHVPVAFFQKDIISFTLANEINIHDSSKVLVNIGSVGQPRDEDARAAYAVYDNEKGLITIKRISYDIDKAMSKIIEAGLPKILAERLKLGR